MKRLAAAIVATIVVANTSPASAESREGFLERVCPNGAALKILDRRVEEAWAMQDSDRNAISRDLSRALYRCSTRTPKPYAKDTAALLSGNFLLLASPRTREAPLFFAHVATLMNDLAASTRFSDVRLSALDTKRLALNAEKEMQAAIDSVDGATESPSPSPTPEQQ